MSRPDAGRHVAIIGLGVIGSYLAGLVARIPSVRHITLVDPDSYDATNLLSQDIGVRDRGKPKVRVAARRIHNINPSLQVTVIATRVEDAPRGLLRADVILGALDSRSARQSVNEISWRLGVPWIDAGVNPDHDLVRITTYAPAPDAACWECLIGADGYAALEAVYWCGAEVAPATRAPAYLGSVAASLQAAECHHVLHGTSGQQGGVREVVLSPGHRTHRLTTCIRNPHCRWDHRVWDVERVPTPPSRMSLRRALSLCGNGQRDGVRIYVEGHRFVLRHSCHQCGGSAKQVALSDRLPPPPCPGCGGPTLPDGFYTRDYLDAATCLALPRQTLGSLGLRTADIISIEAGDTLRYFQLGG